MGCKYSVEYSKIVTPMQKPREVFVKGFVLDKNIFWFSKLVSQLFRKHAQRQWVKQGKT